MDAASDPASATKVAVLRKRWLTCLGIGLVTAGFVIAVYLNPTDRLEQIARWNSVLVSPEYAFIGDSLTKSGGLWGWRLDRNPLRAINLAQNGAKTADIAIQAEKAAAYRPHRIVVMAGTNDADRAVEAIELHNTWRRLFSAAGTTPVIVFLPPRSSDPLLNDRLRAIDSVVRRAAAEANACLADFNDAIAPTGILESQYTTDGVHFTEMAYAVWVARLPEIARSCRG